MLQPAALIPLQTNRTLTPTHSEPRTKSTNVVFQQHSLILLKMGILIPQSCRVSKKKKIASDFSSGATALQGLGRQSGRRRSAKLVPTFADRGVSRGQRNESPRPLISVYRNWIVIHFIQVAPQLTSRGSRG